MAMEFDLAMFIRSPTEFQQARRVSLRLAMFTCRETSTRRWPSAEPVEARGCAPATLGHMLVLIGFFELARPGGRFT
jgi:hypothetical protein